MTAFHVWKVCATKLVAQSLKAQPANRNTTGRVR